MACDIECGEYSHSRATLLLAGVVKNGPLRIHQGFKIWGFRANFLESDNVNTGCFQPVAHAFSEGCAHAIDVDGCNPNHEYSPKRDREWLLA